MSVILTKDLAQQAVDIVRPAIQMVLGSELAGGRQNFHLVVLDPETGDILYEEAFGDKSKWPYPFDEIARSKAQLCDRTDMVGSTLQKDAPWLYEEGDTRYSGGVIENGLVIAGSGLQVHFDEMISWWVLSAIQGICRDHITQIDDDNDPDYFPLPPR